MRNVNEYLCICTNELIINVMMYVKRIIYFVTNNPHGTIIFAKLPIYYRKQYSLLDLLKKVSMPLKKHFQ